MTRQRVGKKGCSCRGTDFRNSYASSGVHAFVSKIAPESTSSLMNGLAAAARSTRARRVRMTPIRVGEVLMAHPPGPLGLS